MRTGRSLTVCRSLLPGGVSASLLGVPAPRRVSAPGGVCSGGVCFRGCLLRGGVCSQGGVSAPGGSAPRGMVSQHALRQTPPLVNRMTNRCKNITLATASLRPETNLVGRDVVVLHNTLVEGTTVPSGNKRYRRTQAELRNQSELFA